jgi:hypothetical protein
VANFAIRAQRASEKKDSMAVGGVESELVSQGDSLI